MASPILGSGALQDSILGTPLRPRQTRSPVPLHIILGASSTSDGVAAKTIDCPVLHLYDFGHFAPSQRLLMCSVCKSQASASGTPDGGAHAARDGFEGASCLGSGTNWSAFEVNLER